MEKFMISVQLISLTNITYDQWFFATKKFSFFTEKLIFFGIFCFSTVNSSILVTKKIIHLFSISQNWQKKKKKTLLRTVYAGRGKTFSPTRSFNFITSIQMQRRIQPIGMLCENSGVSMECNNLFISCVVHKNDHGSWTLYDVSTKKMHEANSEERWKPTKFHNQNTAT
jgi:hypothetical protein